VRLKWELASPEARLVALRVASTIDTKIIMVFFILNLQKIPRNYT
jgi:hypothetical protein